MFRRYKCISASIHQAWIVKCDAFSLFSSIEVSVEDKTIMGCIMPSYHNILFPYSHNVCHWITVILFRSRGIALN